MENVYITSIGSNIYGALGSEDPNVVIHTEPFSSIISSVASSDISISCGSNQTCFITKSINDDKSIQSSIYTWGGTVPLLPSVTNISTASNNTNSTTLTISPFPITTCSMMKLNPILITNPSSSRSSNTLSSESSLLSMTSLSTLSLLPLSISLSIKIETITLGMHHGLCLDTEGNVYTWGKNNVGQLGREINESDISTVTSISTIPTRITNFGPSSEYGPVHIISTGWNHNAIITTSNQLYLWGDDSHGQCNGLSNTIIDQYGSSNNVSSISSSASSTSLCVPRPTRVTLFDGIPINYSQIPLSFQTNVSPVSNTILISNSQRGCITRVACGTWHTGIITLMGEIFTCGDSSHGALGYLKDNNESVNVSTNLPSNSLGHGMTMEEITAVIPTHKLFEAKYERGCLTGIEADFRQVHIPTEILPSHFPHKRYRNDTGSITDNSIIAEDIYCNTRSTLIKTTTNTIYVWGNGCLPMVLHRNNSLVTYGLQRFTLIPQRLPFEEYLSVYLPPTLDSTNSRNASIIPRKIVMGREHYVIVTQINV